MLIDLFIVILLVCIFIQDWKDRAVYWFIFPLLAVSGIIKAHLSGSLHGALYAEWLMSFAFLVMNTLFLLFYIKIKKKSGFSQLSQYIGLGDLLFFVTLVFFGTFLHFIVFYTGSLAGALILWLILKKYSRYEHVPLAGLQALCMLPIWMYIAITKLNPYQDDQLLQIVFN